MGWVIKFMPIYWAASFGVECVSISSTKFLFGQAIMIFFHHKVIILLPERLMCSKPMRCLKCTSNSDKSPIRGTKMIIAPWLDDVQALALTKRECVLGVSQILEVKL
jgi:hypothetical protein